MEIRYESGRPDLKRILEEEVAGADGNNVSVDGKVAFCLSL